MRPSITLPQDAIGLGQMLIEGLLRPTNVIGARFGPEGTIIYPGQPSGALATAMGRFIQMHRSSINDPDVRKHELRHARQSRALGLGYLPMSLREMGYEYGEGPMERDALVHVTPRSAEFYTSANPRAEAYLRGLMGEE